MTDGFEVTNLGNQVIVQAEAFRLIFDVEYMGIVSYAYLKGGVWHEGVEPSGEAPILFEPYFRFSGPPAETTYPGTGSSISVNENYPEYVKIVHTGFMTNDNPSSTNHSTLTITYSLWPSGRVFIRVSAIRMISSPPAYVQEGYRLNPILDTDINLYCDSSALVKWIGFYSGNSGDFQGDKSQDAVLTPYDKVFTDYEELEGRNRIFRDYVLWQPGETIGRSFLLALACNGSWGDTSNETNFQSRGDSLASDYLSPDPLNGASGAGEVITGTKTGDGFDESNGGYVVESE
jgi:hypothetical protein